MRAPLLVPLVAALVASGCLVVGQEAPRVYDVQASLEPSMLPDFGDAGEDRYLFVQVHYHVFPSPDEVREMNDPDRPRVVCLRLDGVTPALDLSSKPAAAPAADMAMACMPAVDPGAGRLFMNRTEFERIDPMGVAVVGDCDSQIVPILADEPGLTAGALGQQFRAEFLANQTLLVDGRWYVGPGEALKIEYAVAGPKPGGDDDRRAKIVFDYAGHWLRSNVAPQDLGEPVLPRPREGNGPEVWLPREPGSLRDVVEPLVGAVPDAGERINHLRLSAVGGRLTDVQAGFTGARTVDWFVAGGDESRIRLLGAVGDHRRDGGADLGRFRAAFDPLGLAPNWGAPGGIQAHEVRWAPEVALQSTMPVPWSETWAPTLQPCKGGCTWVWTSTPVEGEGWRLVDQPRMVEGDDALTLTFARLEGAERLVEQLYHVP